MNDANIERGSSSFEPLGRGFSAQTLRDCDYQPFAGFAFVWFPQLFPKSSHPSALLPPTGSLVPVGLPWAGSRMPAKGGSVPRSEKQYFGLSGPRLMLANAQLTDTAPDAWLSNFSIVYGSALRLSFVRGLPAPIRPAARSRKVEVGLETFFIHSTHPAGERSIIFWGCRLWLGAWSWLPVK
jgi:hypothetical protein